LTEPTVVPATRFRYTLGVKAKANKSNPPRINWRCGFNIGIRLFFKFNIVASKEFRLTIISSLEVQSRRHAASSSACSIVEM